MPNVAPVDHALPGSRFVCMDLVQIRAAVGIVRARDHQKASIAERNESLIGEGVPLQELDLCRKICRFDDLGHPECAPHVVMLARIVDRKRSPALIALMLDHIAKSREVGLIKRLNGPAHIISM